MEDEIKRQLNEKDEEIARLKSDRNSLLDQIESLEWRLEKLSKKELVENE